MAGPMLGLPVQVVGILTVPPGVLVWDRSL